MKQLKIFTAIIFFLCLMVVQDLFGQWNQMYSVSQSPNHIYFSLDYNPDGSIFAGREGNVSYSVNGGTSWNEYYQVGTTPCFMLASSRSTALYFLDKDSGFVAGNVGGVGSSNFLYKTTNTFTNRTCKVTITNVSYSDPLGLHMYGDSVIVIDNKGGLAFSADRGTTWTQSVIPGLPGSFAAYSTAFTPGMVYVFGNSSYCSFDHGNTFVSRPGISGVTFKSCSFVNDSVGFMLGDKSGTKMIYKTVNRGLSWVPLFQAMISESMRDIQFINQDTGYVVGTNLIMKTEDGGQSWGIKRMSNTDFTKIKFYDADNGVAAGNSSTNSIIYKTTNGGGSYAPWSYFYFTNTACCANVICNVYNGGSPSYNYKWYLDGALISSAFSPGSITASGGNHTLKLVTTYLGLSDSVTKTFYSAPPWTGYTLSASLLDSTVCNGYPAQVSVNSNAVFTYYLSASGTSISSTYTGTGSPMTISSVAIDSSFNLAINALSPYYYCPGNTFTQNFYVTELPTPPDNLLSVSRDSICEGDTFSVFITNNDPGATYQVYSGNYNQTQSLVSTFTGSPASYTYPHPSAIHSKHIKYVCVGSNGCVMNTVPNTRVYMDSVFAVIGNSAPAVFVNDTITIYNNSIEDFHHWAFTQFPVSADSGSVHGNFSFSNPGQSWIHLYASNTTGCNDSTKIEISILDSAQLNPGQLCSSIATTLQSPIYIGCESRARAKLHVDKFGNHYVYMWRNVGIAGGQDYYSFFLQKYDAAGNLKYTLQPVYSSSNYYNTTASSIDSDSLGNVFINGNYYAKTFSVGGQTLTNSVMRAGCFLAKIDSSGNTLWLKNYLTQGINNGEPTGELKVADPGNIFFHMRFTLYQLDGNGIQKKAMAMPSGPEDLMFEFIGHCNTYYSEVASYGPKVAIYRNKIIVFTLHATSSGQSSASVTLPQGGGSIPFSQLTGIVSIFDSSGIFLNAFKAFEVKYPSYNVTYDVIQPNMAVDDEGNIYLSHSPYGNYYVKDSIVPEIRWDYDIPQKGLFPNMGGKSLLEKFDLQGNLVYANFTNANISGLAATGQGEIAGIANYCRFSSFESSDNKSYGLITEDSTSNSVVFSYDSAGTMKWLVALESPDSDFGDNIVTHCGDSRIWFLAYGFDTLKCMSTVSPVTYKYMMYTLSPDNMCVPQSTCQWSPWPFTQLVTEALNTQQIVEENRMKVWPNPAKDFFSIENISAGSTINLYDISGRLILSQKSNSSICTVNTNTLQNGIFIIEVTDETLRNFQRIVISR